MKRHGEEVEAAFAMVVLWFSNSLDSSLSVIFDITLMLLNEGNCCSSQVRAATQVGTGDFEAVPPMIVNCEGCQQEPAQLSLYC